MKRTTLLTVTMVGLIALPAAQGGGFKLLDALVKISIGSDNNSESAGVKNAEGAKSTTSWGGAGHQIANIPDIGQGTGVTLDEDGNPVEGEPVDLAGLQSMESTTATNTANLDTALDFIKSNQSDVTNAGNDANQADTGDKNKAGPSVNTAATGNGNPVATQPVATPDTVTVDRAEYEAFVEAAMANKKELDALKNSTE